MATGLVKMTTYTSGAVKTELIDETKYASKTDIESIKQSLMVNNQYDPAHFSVTIVDNTVNPPAYKISINAALLKSILDRLTLLESKVK